MAGREGGESRGAAGGDEPAARVIGSVDDALALVGHELGNGAWLTIEQSTIDGFAEVTGDHQWVHVDRERAARESPYRATIAHGYLTLSLIPHLTADIVHFGNARMVVNYGLDKVRFLAPVVVGSRVRARSALTDARVRDGGAVDLMLRHTIELAGSDRPAMVADTIARALY